ncbi:nickel-dependent hydrogenase large subunit [candidate division WOR-3 bacterium]|nr:nickel-dependent hydrogenase large subunit [candidate division WOR-3 bacterium]
MTIIPTGGPLAALERKVIPIGPFHPLQEEAEYFKLTVEGEKVVGLDIQLGYMHRGHEKICEGKTYDQIPFVVERICGICSTSHPFACVQAIEDAAGIEIPPRAAYIRTIVGELERIHSHLLWVGLAGHFLGYNTVWMWAWKYRESVLEISELITGNRNHYAMFKPGGVRRDIEGGMIPPLLQVLDDADKKILMLTKAVLDDPVLHKRLEGVGVLTPEMAVEYSVVGPTARASGLAIDVRKDDPHAAYDWIEWEEIVLHEGDVFAKAKVRLLECLESTKIIRQCVQKLKDLPEGEIDAHMERGPDGEGVGRYEAPRGEVFHYVKGDGSLYPRRYKIRAPSFMNIKSNEVAVLGSLVADAAITLAAVDPCYCCTERIAAFNTKGKLLYTWDDLVKLSQEKTARMGGGS